MVHEKFETLDRTYLDMYVDIVAHITFKRPIACCPVDYDVLLLGHCGVNCLGAERLRFIQVFAAHSWRPGLPFARTRIPASPITLPSVASVQSSVANSLLLS
jgi:hypothetical protein